MSLFLQYIFDCYLLNSIYIHFLTESHDCKIHTQSIFSYKLPERYLCMYAPSLYCVVPTGTCCTYGVTTTTYN